MTFERMLKEAGSDMQLLTQLAGGSGRIGPPVAP